jgi:hypothetical protein
VPGCGPTFSASIGIKFSIRNLFLKWCGVSQHRIKRRGPSLAQPIDVDDIGIEVVNEPFFEFAVALAVGIGDGFEEPGALGTADVLGRPSHHELSSMAVPEFMTQC